MITPSANPETQTRKLDLSWCEKGGQRGYVTTRDLHWPVGRKASNLVVLIPVGTEFESSVPKRLHRYWSPDDPHFLLSALVHDFLLEDGWDLDFADSQWLAAARKSGASKRRAMFARFMMLLRRWWHDDHRGITWKVTP